MGRQLCKIVFVVALLVTAVARASSETPDKLSLVRTALSNYINYDMCWGAGGKNRGSPYYRGRTSTLSLEFNKGGTKFYVWGNTLQYAPFAPHHPPIDDQFFGAISGDKAAIIGMGGPLSNPLAEMPQRPVLKFSYTVPTKCKMVFPSSQRKTEMVNTLVKSITAFVEEAKRLGAQNPYHLPLHIAIADFDVYYPQTFFYINQTHELYVVNLQDPDDYFGDSFLKDGYMFNLVNYFSPNSPLVEKIKKYGIFKTINSPEKTKDHAR